MARLSVSVSDEQMDWIESKVGDDARYESKSAFVRECLQRYDRVEELDAQVSDLRNQLQEANRRNEEVTDLADYVNREKKLQVEERERRRAPLLHRVKWLIWGYDDE